MSVDRNRWALRTLVLILLLPVVTRAEEEVGIRWEGSSLADGLVRAAAEGRPVLLAVNALDTESANQNLAHVLYPSPAWGRATRPWVAFVANPDVHGEGTVCARYGRIPCSTHQEVLRTVIRRFARDGDLISPQHLILDPDGRLAFRKPFFTGVVGPAFFESWLPRLSPSLAIDHAADLRVDRIDALDQASTETLEEIARAWLAEDDPLAPGGVLCAADFAASPARQEALIRALGTLPPTLLPVPMVAAWEAAMDPDASPAVTEAWIRTVLEIDATAGLDLAARAAVRTKDAGARRRLLALLFEGKPVPGRSYRVGGSDWLSPTELLRAETFRALGRSTVLPKKKVEGTLPDDWARQVRVLGSAENLARAARRAKKGDALVHDAADVARLRHALVAASPEDVRQHEVFVRRIFRDREEEPLKVAAALALLGARLDESGKVPRVVQAAVFDPVESVDIRPEAVRRLGQDPGHGEDAWLEALRAHIAGGK